VKQLYHIHYVIIEPNGYERGEDEYVRAGDRERVERHAEAYLLREVFEIDGDRLADAAELDQSDAGYWRNPDADETSAKYDIEPIDAVPVIDLDADDQSADSLRVEQWLYSGCLSSGVERVGVSFDEVLSDAGRLLDQGDACEIVGEVLFQGTDGQWYTLTVEAVIAQADPDYVRDSLGLTNAEAAVPV
jgi:hypothetical protein